MDPPDPDSVVTPAFDTASLGAVKIRILFGFLRIRRTPAFDTACLGAVHHGDADPDPTYHPDADPDSDFYLMQIRFFYADADLAYQNDADSSGFGCYPDPQHC